MKGREGSTLTRVHVVGAGLAGLSAAVALAARGVAVDLIEASAQAGGRCRSYLDPVLEMTIDNGNHLVLSGNRAVFNYLRVIGAEDRLIGPDEATLDFHDLRDGARWTIRPNPGPLPWWVLSPRRRIPGTRAADYLALLALTGPQGARRIDQAMARRGPLWERLLEPFLLAALNTEPRSGSAALAGAVIGESLARGGKAYRPRVAHPGLSAAFVDPALAFLAARGARVRFGQPARALTFEGDRVTAIATAEGDIAVGDGEAVILATPPWISRELVPGLEAPDAFNAIVNGHFKLAPPTGAPPIVGVIGGAAQWIFAFPDRLSVTVSDAGAMADQGRDDLAHLFWGDIAAVLGLSGPLPPWRIVKERRATFAATPEQNAKRPPAATRWGNLALAGDWTATGLPATIEGAIRSGQTAAAVIG
ncbi:MAG: FAD-dependent oxidoreductase [Caulobacteraceae bacterium]|nr:FAD-dependent oxidoreductase [Caulobacteraceae bacterium]